MTFSGFSGPIHFHADDTMKHQPHRKYYIVTTDPCIELCISVRAELPKQETHLCLLFPGLQEEHWDIMYVQQTKYTTLLRCQTQLATVHQSSRHVFVGSPRVSWQLQGTVCLAYHRSETRDQRPGSQTALQRSKTQLITLHGFKIVMFFQLSLYLLEGKRELLLLHIGPTL